MPKVEFNSRITLQKRIQGTGRSGMSISAEMTVWGAVEETSLTFKATAGQSGLRPSLFIHLWRREFEKNSFNYCVVSGTAYRISMTGKSYNEQYVKLLLERG